MAQYLSVSQYAAKYQKDVGNIRRMLLSNRLNGIKIGNQWAIESSTPYPNDKRVSDGSFINYRKILILKKNKRLFRLLDTMFNELSSIYGKNIVKIIIYGAYARGEQEEDSGIDIALFINKLNEKQRSLMLDCVTKYEDEIGKSLSVIEIENKIYDKWMNTLPIYKSIKKEGITLWQAKAQRKPQTK